MSRAIQKFILVFCIAFAAFGAIFVALGQAQRGMDGGIVVSSESQDGNLREITTSDSSTGNAPSQPNIGFIDSPTAACTKPDPAKDECYINWYYLSVAADPNYMITMTVKLNSIGFVARYQGFFQTSMYAPHTMNPQGYKVPCGVLQPNGWGNAYAYTIRARDSANLSSANYGTVYCPAHIP